MMYVVFRILLIAMLIASGTNAAFAQMKPGIPYGWKLHGSRAEKYECGVDRDTVRDGKPSAYLRSLSSTIPGDAIVLQYLAPDKFIDQRIQVSGWVKTKDVTDMAGLWVRLGSPTNDMVGFDNMENRPVKGTTEWTKYSVVLDIPPDTREIAFGFSLHGPGTLWVNDLTFTTVAKTVPTTNLLKKKHYPDEPVNIDFTDSK